MKLFRRKKDNYIDLGEKLRKQEDRLEKFQNNNSIDEVHEVKDIPEPENQGGFMGFFGGTASKVEDTIESPTEERRKKLKSILNGLSQRLDDQEKEIYRLKQNLEVIERKQSVGYR